MSKRKPMCKIWTTNDVIKNDIIFEKYYSDVIMMASSTQN